jgi:hypothetical protein
MITATVFFPEYLAPERNSTSTDGLCRETSGQDILHGLPDQGRIIHGHDLYLIGHGVLVYGLGLSEESVQNILGFVKPGYWITRSVTPVLDWYPG